MKFPIRERHRRRILKFTANRAPLARGVTTYARRLLFRSRAALQAEILVLRHQVNVLRRRSPKRVAVGNIDRLVFAGLYRLVPEVLDALKISSRRRSSAGIALVSERDGAGNRDRVVADRGQLRSFANSFVR